MAPRLSAADFKSRSAAQAMYPDDDETEEPYAVGLDKATKAMRRKKRPKKLLSNAERRGGSPLGGQAVQRSVLGAKR
jgi:hypothetical protein